MLLLNMRYNGPRNSKYSFYSLSISKTLKSNLRYIDLNYCSPWSPHPIGCSKPIMINEVSYFDNFTFNLTLKYLEHQKPKFGLNPKLNDFNYLNMSKIIMFSPNWCYKSLIKCKNYLWFHPILSNPIFDWKILILSINLIFKPLFC